MKNFTAFTLNLDLLSRRLGKEFRSEKCLPVRKNVFFRELFFSSLRDSVSKRQVERVFNDIEDISSPLFLNTDGMYHHLTYGAVKRLSDQKVGYIHVDNHPDCSTIDSNGGDVGFNNFVRDIDSLPNVEDVLLVGSEHQPLKSVGERHLIEESWFDELEAKLEEFPEKVYLSVDLDVFNPFLWNSRFDNGFMNWRLFHETLLLIEQKNIVGADIVGLERPVKQDNMDLYRAVLERLQGDKTDPGLQESSLELHPFDMKRQKKLKNKIDRIV